MYRTAIADIDRQLEDLDRQREPLLRAREALLALTEGVAPSATPEDQAVSRAGPTPAAATGPKSLRKRVATEADKARTLRWLKAGPLRPGEIYSRLEIVSEKGRVMLKELEKKKQVVLTGNTINRRVELT